MGILNATVLSATLIASFAVVFAAVAQLITISGRTTVEVILQL